MDKEKIYIGISLGFNSSASIISTKHGVLCCVSEERLNRIKNTKALPMNAVAACLKTAAQKLGHDITSIDGIAYSHYEGLSIPYIKKNYVKETYCPSIYLDIDKALKTAESINGDKAEWLLLQIVKSALGKTFLKSDKLNRIEHHTAHEASIFPQYLKDCKSINVTNNITMTADGFGDGYSGKINVYHKVDCSWQSFVRVIDSPALVYQFFTGALGFKEHQHEGKVTGLAAHAADDPNAIEVEKLIFERLTGKNELSVVPATELTTREIHDGKTFEYNNTGFWVDEDLLLPLTEEQEEMVKTSTIIDFERFLRLKNTVYDLVKNWLGKNYDKDNILDWLNGTKDLPTDMIYTPWAIAAGVQKFAEDVILNWLKSIPAKYMNDSILCAAGGLMANVKLNQKIKDANMFNRIFIAAPMGDEGTAIGCAVKHCINENGYFIENTNEAEWLGPKIIVGGGTSLDYDDSLKSVIDEASTLDNLEVTYFSDRDKLIDSVTDMLAEDKIVHWCQNAEEFGPRALMNHSTLYTAKDPNGTHTLNQAMGRSEYMPYCPVCKNTSADKLFYNWQPGEDSCRFMAMTMDCKPGVKDIYRGGVHVDNTARAQFVYEKDEWTKDAWKLLDSYEKKTGNLMMINTSFNIHNTPTCNLASDCWDAWKKSNFVGAALAIGNYLIKNK